jgi:DNA-binding HxlR family transcriptional regulator
MRGHLRTLTETGIARRQRQNSFPGAVHYELTPAGQALAEVAGILGTWLVTAPESPLQLGSNAARNAIKALVDGWSTSMIRALAAMPLSLTDLNGLIGGVSYPSLERRLSAMRLVGLIEKTQGRSRGTPYAVTPWLRRAIAPLAAAARWERLFVATETAPIKRLDAEAAFLLALPLLRLPPESSGSCRLAVEFNANGVDKLAGVMAAVDEGRVVGCGTKLKGDADAWAVGSSTAWLQAAIDRDSGQLDVGGDCQLARSLLDGLHDVLFEMRERPRRS